MLSKPGAGLRAEGIVNALIADLTEALHATKTAQEHLGDSDQKRLIAEAIQLVDRLIDKGEIVSIARLATMLYVSRTRLCAIFSEEMGVGLGAYMRKQRLERGSELLLDMNLRIVDIAASLGYPSPTAFTQAFTQMFGLSPTAWRRQHA
ncbi:AraC family transcriptional regulator [Collinsella sp. AGMB00827]|uniref:AraC family transcriptional regulator n=1 Tax=Collinsella ureilytica TaxID=2869515 RepID=A0ABS7MM44_9ACTN|nr:AraC family transcriptional regulator [Collinsella urealyticum]MBY4798175.1 AraC family transcriptional regulator [Collinsella urealyticum]